MDLPLEIVFVARTEPYVATRETESERKETWRLKTREKKKEEGEKMENFFCSVHEFLTSYSSSFVDNVSSSSSSSNI